MALVNDGGVASDDYHTGTGNRTGLVPGYPLDICTRPLFGMTRFVHIGRSGFEVEGELAQ